MKSFNSSAGSPKNFVAALIVEHEQLPLDGADRLFRHVAVLRGQLVGVLGDETEDRAQVLHIEQRQTLLVGDAEGDIEHAFLHLVEIHQPRQQQRTHLGDGGADRMTLLAEQVPENGREFVRFVIEPHAGRALDQPFLGLAHRRDAGEIALDVGRENRNAGARKTFRQDLQGHGLAGSGRAGDEPVPVGKRKRQILGLDAAADEDAAVLVDRRRSFFFFRAGFTVRIGFGRFLSAFRHHPTSLAGVTPKIKSDLFECFNI